jgi:small neutral amino acid transporter SnatA (MarC family)
MMRRSFGEIQTQRALGDSGLRAVTRLMGMILTVMAVQMMLNGLTVWLRSIGLVTC